MKNLPSVIVNKTNSLAQGDSWLILLDIFYPGNATDSPDKQFVNNNDDLVFEGDTYSGTPFSISSLKESMQGELPKTVLTVFDVNLDLVSDLQSNAGFSGGRVVIRKVPFDSNGLPEETKIVEYYDILNVNADDEAISFNIGVGSPLTKRFPRDRYVSTICRHRFRDGMCQFTNGTLTDTDIGFVHFIDTSKRDFIATSDSADGLLFTMGQIIRITGSGSNNGDYTIEIITRISGRTFIMFAAGSNKVALSTEVAGASVTIAAI